MSTRGVRFFAMPIEFTNMINEIISSLQLKVLLAPGKRNAKIKTLIVPLNLEILKQLDVSEFFLTDQKVHEGILVSEVNIPKEGWVQVLIPKEIPGKLFKGSLGIKTDWYDKEYDAIIDNKNSISLYNKILRRIKKHLEFPLIGYDIRTGTSHTYPIGYTHNAKKFLKEGGELASGINETDIRNSRFAVDKSDIRVDPNFQLPIK